MNYDDSTVQTKQSWINSYHIETPYANPYIILFSFKTIFSSKAEIGLKYLIQQKKKERKKQNKKLYELYLHVMNKEVHNSLTKMTNVYIRDTKISLHQTETDKQKSMRENY